MTIRKKIAILLIISLSFVLLVTIVILQKCSQENTISIYRVYNIEVNLIDKTMTAINMIENGQKTFISVIIKNSYIDPYLRENRIIHYDEPSYTLFFLKNDKWIPYHSKISGGIPFRINSILSNKKLIFFFEIPLELKNEKIKLEWNSLVSNDFIPSNLPISKFSLFENEDDDLDKLQLSPSEYYIEKNPITQKDKTVSIAFILTNKSSKAISVNSSVLHPRILKSPDILNLSFFIDEYDPSIINMKFWKTISEQPVEYLNFEPPGDKIKIYPGDEITYIFKTNMKKSQLIGKKLRLRYKGITSSSFIIK